MTRFTFYLPTEPNEGISAVAHDDALKLLLGRLRSIAGGLTLMRGDGEWIAFDGSVVHERVLVVTAICDSYLPEINRYLREFTKATAQQETLYTFEDVSVIRRSWLVPKT